MGQEKMVPAVFLDRDGVINKDIGYFSDPKKLAIFRSSLEGLRALQEAGFMLIVVTNQSGIARGLISEKDVQNLHDVMQHAFQKDGIFISGIIYCPHHPTEGINAYRTNCKCRKPSPGMIFQAAEKFNIDLNQSYLVGDRFSDIQAGINAGLKSSILLESKHEISQEEISKASTFCQDLAEAASWIIGSNPKKK